MEARNAATLKRNFAADSRVVVPEVVGDLVRRRVLVLEYVEGTRIDRLHQRLESGELRLDQLMATLAEMYIKMMLEDGVFHADPHAGNLLVDMNSPKVFASMASHHGAKAPFSYALPTDVTFCGLTLTVQGVCSGTPRTQLSNALDLVLGS